MTGQFGQLKEWGGNFDDARNRFSRAGRMHYAFTNFGAALSHDTGNPASGNLDLSEFTSLAGIVGASNKTDVNGLTQKFAAPWAISTAWHDGAALHVVYTTTSRRVRHAVIDLQPGNPRSVISEETVMELPAGWTIGRVDVDISVTGGNTGTAPVDPDPYSKAIAVAVLARDSTSTAAVFVSLKDTTGTWSPTPAQFPVDTTNYNLGTLASPVRLANEFVGPLSIEACHYALPGEAGAKTCHMHVMARAAEYGAVELWKVEINRDNSSVIGAVSKIEGDLAPASRQSVETAGNIFSIMPAIYGEDVGLLVAAATQQQAYLGERQADGGWTTAGMTALPLSLPGVPPQDYPQRPKNGDESSIAIVAGPGRVAFQVVREVTQNTTSNSTQKRHAVYFAHGLVQEGQGDKEVLWHVSAGSSPRISWDARITNIFNGMNIDLPRDFRAAASIGWNVGRMSAFFFYKVNHRASSPTAALNAAYLWNGNPTEDGAVASPIDASSVDTDTPTLVTPVITGSKSGLDTHALMEVWQEGSPMHATFFTPWEAATFLGAHSAAVPSDDRLHQGAWRAGYAEADVHGALSRAGGTPASYSSFTVAHPPTTTAHIPSGGAGVAGSAASAAVELSWVFADTSPLDAQTAYQVQSERITGGADHQDTGKVASSSQTLTRTVTGSLYGSLFRWRVKVWDGDDVEGPWSDWHTFFPAETPGLTWNSPVVDGEVNSPRQAIDWYDYSTGFGVPIQYKVIVKRGGNTVHDSGWMDANDAFSRPYSPAVAVFERGVTYTIEVHTRWAEGGLVTFASKSVLATWAIPAAVPLVVDTSPFPVTANINLDWSGHTTSMGWVGYRLYRSPSPLGTDAVLVADVTGSSITSFDDHLAPAGKSYYAVVEVVLLDGVQIEGARTWFLAEAADDHYWLIDPNDQAPTGASLTTRLAHVTGEPFTSEVEEAVLPIIGRGRRVEIGTRWGYSGTLSAQLRGLGPDAPRVERMKIEAVRLSGRTMYLRNPFGDLYKIALGEVTFTREAGTPEEYLQVEIPYVEVV